MNIGRTSGLLGPKQRRVGLDVGHQPSAGSHPHHQPAKLPLLPKTQPIDVPGSSGSFSPRLSTPKQGSEAARGMFLRQGSDAELDAQDSAAAAAVNAQAPASPQPLGSWAGRQRLLPLPAKPTGFPARFTKAHTRKQPAGNDADAAWHYAFRRKWRREQLRALVDGPDYSPSASGVSPLVGDADMDAGMIFGLDDVSPPSMQHSAALPAQLPAAMPAARPAAASTAPAPTAADEPLSLPPIKTLPPKPQPAGEVLPPVQDIPGLAPIRRVVMRGPTKPVQGGNVHTGKVKTVTDRMWIPKMTSPARASQAA